MRVRTIEDRKLGRRAHAVAPGARRRSRRSSASTSPPTARAAPSSPGSRAAAEDRQIVAGYLDRPPGFFAGYTSQRCCQGPLPRLSWQPSFNLWGPVRYVVTVDGKPVGETTETRACSSRRRSPRATHRWQVVAVDARGQSKRSRTRTLRIDAARAAAERALQAQAARRDAVGARARPRRPRAHARRACARSSCRGATARRARAGRPSVRASHRYRARRQLPAADHRDRPRRQPAHVAAHRAHRVAGRRRMRRPRVAAAGRTLALGERPWLMGIVNASPDSFSDAGAYPDLDARVALRPRAARRRRGHHRRRRRVGHHAAPAGRGRGGDRARRAARRAARRRARRDRLGRHVQAGGRRRRRSPRAP